MATLPLLRPYSFLRTPTLTLTLTLTLKTPTTKIPFLPLKPQNGGVGARMSNSSSSPAATERLISVAAYGLPLLNSVQHGRYLMAQFPKLGVLLEPILPFLAFYRSIPYSSFVAFFALYLGVVRNPSFPRYVRFNAMQAVTLDVLLVIPLLFHRIFSTGTGPIMVFSSNAIFVFSVFCFLYAVVSCVLGRTPYLPFVADAASRQI
ncbi:protein TIC 20-II, chloroplastic [Cajanus cajan]|uniref:Protein TIC 20 n=1 Tax=Cajanus cajan TaxID=3821 RepID=A0A151TB04_CAJCA|nr:protein TIC 20-II, chloroplastic [Cajanus cajan]KYP64184.1 Ycf60-like protein [Cajanus cajan]